MRTIPGFVDLQVNGYLGVDFSSPDLTEEQFLNVCDQLRQAGTAAFLTTLVTSPVEVYRRNLPLIAGLLNETPAKGCVLGFHIEGPFLSPEPGARGVHPVEHIIPPDTTIFDEMMELSGDTIRMLTIGADVDHAEKLSRHATERGVTVSLGHHIAGEDDLSRMADAGAKALTHLGNGVPMMLNRHHNPILAGLAEDRLTGMIITDGFHLPPSLIKIIFRCKGVSNLVVTSDAAPLAGMPPGHYNSLGGEVVLEESGRLGDAHSEYLAGSASTMLQCMNMLASMGILTYDELIAVGYDNPLSLIGSDAGLIQSELRLAYDPRELVFRYRHAH